MQQQANCSRVVAYHPTEYAVACGFDDGAVRVFDIASTSLLEEYRQHRGPVAALAYAHAAHRLYSASHDGGLCAYDVLHSYQPCRSFTAATPADSPCIAIAPDDNVIAVGGLQSKALLLFDASLTLLRELPLPTELHALFGPSQVLHASTANRELLSFARRVGRPGAPPVPFVGEPDAHRMVWGPSRSPPTAATS